MSKRSWSEFGMEEEETEEKKEEEKEEETEKENRYENTLESFNKFAHEKRFFIALAIALFIVVGIPWCIYDMYYLIRPLLTEIHKTPNELELVFHFTKVLVVIFVVIVALIGLQYSRPKIKANYAFMAFSLASVLPSSCSYRFWPAE